MVDNCMMCDLDFILPPLINDLPSAIVGFKTEIKCNELKWWWWWCSVSYTNACTMYVYMYVFMWRISFAATNNIFVFVVLNVLKKTAKTEKFVNVNAHEVGHSSVWPISVALRSVHIFTEYNMLGIIFIADFDWNKWKIRFKIKFLELFDFIEKILSARIERLDGNENLMFFFVCMVQCIENAWTLLHRLVRTTKQLSTTIYRCESYICVCALYIYTSKYKVKISVNQTKILWIPRFLFRSYFSLLFWIVCAVIDTKKFTIKATRKSQTLWII